MPLSISQSRVVACTFTGRNWLRGTRFIVGHEWRNHRGDWKGHRHGWIRFEVFQEGNSEGMVPCESVHLHWCRCLWIVSHPSRLGGSSKAQKSERCRGTKHTLAGLSSTHVMKTLMFVFLIFRVNSEECAVCNCGISRKQGRMIITGSEHLMLPVGTIVCLCEWMGFHCLHMSAKGTLLEPVYVMLETSMYAWVVVDAKM